MLISLFIRLKNYIFGKLFSVYEYFKFFIYFLINEKRITKKLINNLKNDVSIIPSKDMYELAINILSIQLHKDKFKLFNFLREYDKSLYKVKSNSSWLDSHIAMLKKLINESGK